ETPVPKVGGLALISSLLIVSLFRGFSLPFTRPELACILCMTVVGFVDDRLDLRARHKAAVGLVVAMVLAGGLTYRLGPHLTAFRLLGFAVPHAAWLAFGLLVLLFWCIPQAFNLIDG